MFEFRHPAWIALFTIAVASCSHSSNNEAIKTQAMLSATGPKATPYFPTYAVADIGKKGIPVLSLNQQQWLHRIEESSYYRKHLRTLRFAAMPAVENPLVVFDAGLLFNNVDGDASGQNAFWVIGDPCNDLFATHSGETATTQSLCGHSL